jgi:hypothetical protein
LASANNRPSGSSGEIAMGEKYPIEITLASWVDRFVGLIS